MIKNLKIAVLVDGSFFLKRFKHIYGKKSPKETAEKLYTICHMHVGNENYLYRILYYDCHPIDKRVHNPISKKLINLIKTDQSLFRTNFFEELKRKRKVALRLGVLATQNNWLLRPEILKKLLLGEIELKDLNENDVYLDLRQKRVDMKIGIDIATLALEKRVDRIVLISGDSDFVPASKLARRMGIDFVLDPMWNNIDPFLFEHIDGLDTKCPKPKVKKGIL